MVHFEENASIIPMITHEQLAYIKTVLFDMDGALYDPIQKKGSPNTELHNRYFSRVHSWVTDVNGVSDEMAQSMVEIMLNNKVNISIGLSRFFNTPIDKVNDYIWDINPAEVIHNHVLSVKAARELHDQGKEMFLVSIAARKWIDKVLTYLELTDVFTRVYSGDDFVKKDFLFRKLSKEFDPKRMLSIGDNMATDIVPAHTLGIQVFHVTSSEELYRLVTGNK
jgi:FMN phosphatase YigB (HAD superfamily)